MPLSVAETGMAPASAKAANLANAGTLITHYYQSILGRAPDPGGLAYWQGEAARVTNLGASVNEVWYAMAMSFFFSTEYAAFNRDDAGFIGDLYRTFFSRQPDPGGLSYWTGQLAGGLPRDVALVSFLFSAEFDAFTRSLFGAVLSPAETDTVGDFYRGLLARLPDSGGLNFWVGRFRVAQCDGASYVYSEVEAISSAFATSLEYGSRGRTNAQYVGDLYNAFLRRGGDLGGVLFWIGQLDSGARTREGLRQAFISSPEFNGRVSAMVASGCRPAILDSASLQLATTQSGTITLAGTGSATFPAGTFSGNTSVTIARAKATRPSLNDFTDTTLVFDAGVPYPDAVIVDSGAAQPVGDMTVAIAVADPFLAGMPSGHKPHLFVQAYTAGADAFAPLDSTYDPASKTLAAVVPPWGCTDQRNGLATWECVLVIASLPATATAPSSETKADDFAAAGCKAPLFSPIKGLTPLALSLTPGDTYGSRVDPIAGSAARLQFHQGRDYEVATGTPLVPAADGYVYRMGCSRTYGEFIMIKHTDGSSTLYAHLTMGSIRVKNSSGQDVSYPQCQTSKPTETVYSQFPANQVPVMGGYTAVGTTDTTGARVTGPHLHFEYSAGKIIVGKKGMGGRLNGAVCVTQEPPPATCDAFYCYNKCFDAYLACYNACPSSPPSAALQCMSACDGVFNACPSSTRLPSCTCTL